MRFYLEDKVVHLKKNKHNKKKLDFLVFSIYLVVLIPFLMSFFFKTKKIKQFFYLIIKIKFQTNKLYKTSLQSNHFKCKNNEENNFIIKQLCKMEFYIVLQLAWGS